MKQQLDENLMEQKTQLIKMLHNNNQINEIKQHINKMFTKIKGNNHGQQIEVIIVANIISPLFSAFTDQNKTRKDVIVSVIAWTLNISLQDHKTLPYIKKLLEQVRQHYHQLKWDKIFNQLIENIIKEQPGLYNILELILCLDGAREVETKLKKSTTSITERNALAIYQQEKNGQPTLPEVKIPFLQDLLKYGYSTTASIDIVTFLLGKNKVQITPEFVANLILFVNQTYKNNQLQIIDPYELVNILGLQNVQLQNNNSIPDKWAMNTLFKAVFKFGNIEVTKFQVQDVLFLLKIDKIEEFDANTLFTTLVSMIQQLYTPTCICSDCSSKQNIFPVLQLLIDTNNRMCPGVRILLVQAVISSAITISNNLHRFYQHIKAASQSSSKPTFDPRATEHFILSSFYAYYMSFARLQPYDPNSYDESGYFLDYIAQILHKNGIKTQRSCNRSGCAEGGGNRNFGKHSAPDQSAENMLAGMHYVWRSIDFVKLLLKLRKTFRKQIDDILAYGWSINGSQKHIPPVTDKSGDYLCQSLTHLFLKWKGSGCGDDWMWMRGYVKCVCSLCIYKHFNKQGRTKSNQPVLEAASRAPEIVEFTLECIYRSFPGLCGKLLDTAQEQRCLQLCIKQPCSVYFGLDMATLAAGRQLINLALFLNGQFLQLGLPFAEAVCVFLIKKLVKFRKAVTPEFAEEAFKYTKVVGDEYDDFAALPITLADNEALVNNRIKNALFTEELQSLHLSNAVISESLVGCFFRLLSYYQRYFKLISGLKSLQKTQKLFKRIDMLFDYATELCLSTFPRIPQILASELSQITERIKDHTYDIFCEFFLDDRDNNMEFLAEIDGLFKGQELEKRFQYICAINQMVSGIADQNSFIRYFNCQDAEQDSDSIIHALFEVVGILLGQGLIQDVFQPKLINIILGYIDRQEDLHLIKIFLDAFAESSRSQNQKEEFKGLNFSQDWYSFYNIIQLFIEQSFLKSAQNVQLKQSTMKYFTDQAANCQQSIQEQLYEIENADETQRTKDLFDVLAVPKKLVQAICFDVEIVECIKKHGSPMQYRPVASQLGQHQQLELIKERLAALTSSQMQDPQTAATQVAELRAVREQHLVCQQLAFAAFLERNYEALISAVLAYCPELAQNSLKYCISAVLRLIFLPGNCTACLQKKHVRDRRDAIEVYGKYMGIYCTQRSNLTILSQKILDFNFLIEYAADCGTLDVVSVFICQYLQAMSAQASVMPASNGFTIVVLKKLEQAVEEKFFIPYNDLLDDLEKKIKKSKKSSSSDESDDEYSIFLQELKDRQQLAKQDIEQCRSAMFNNQHDPIVSRGNLLQNSQWFGRQVEPQAKQCFDLVIPQIFRSKQTLQVLAKSTHICMVPLNLTMCFVYENPELLTQLRIVQMQQKYNSQLEVIMKRINDLLQTTVHTMLQHMIPEFTGNVQQAIWKSYYQNIYRETSSVIGCRLLRMHLLKPLAEQIHDSIIKRFSFNQDAEPSIVQQINDKIILQLAYMASEQLITNLQQQINGTIYMRKNTLLTKYELTNELDQTPINDTPSLLPTPEQYSKQIGQNYGQDKLTSQQQELIDKITQMFAESNQSVHMKYVKFDYNLLIQQAYCENSDGMAFTALPMYLFNNETEGMHNILSQYMSVDDQEIIEKMKNGRFPFTLNVQQLLLINKLNNCIIRHRLIGQQNIPQKMLYKLIKKIIITQQQYENRIQSVQMLQHGDQFRVFLNDTLYQILLQYYQLDKQQGVSLLRYLSIYLLSSCNININSQIYQNTNPIQEEYLGDDNLGKHHSINNKIKINVQGQPGNIQIQFKESEDSIIYDLFEQQQDEIQVKIQEYFKNELIDYCLSNNVQSGNELSNMLSQDEKIHIVQHVLLCSNPSFNMSVVFEIIYTIIRFMADQQSQFNNQLQVITTQINKQLKYISSNLLMSCLICDLCKSEVQQLNVKIEDRSVFQVYQSYLENIIHLKQRIDINTQDKSLQSQQIKIYEGLQLNGIIDIDTEIKNIVIKLLGHVSNSKLSNVSSHIQKYMINFPFTLNAIASAVRNIIYRAQWCWEQPVNLDMLYRSHGVINNKEHYDNISYSIQPLLKEIKGIYQTCVEYYIQSHEEHRSSVPANIQSFLYICYMVTEVQKNNTDNIAGHYEQFGQITRQLLEDGCSAVDRNVILSFLFQNSMYIHISDPQESVEPILSQIDTIIFSVLNNHIKGNIDHKCELIQPSADLLVKYLYLCLKLQHEQVNRTCESAPIDSLKVLLLKCIMQRIVQQCNVYSSGQIVLLDKYEVLCKGQNYDLTGYPMNGKRLNGKPEQQENYVRPAIWLAYHILGKLLGLILREEQDESLTNLQNTATFLQGFSGSNPTCAHCTGAFQGPSLAHRAPELAAVILSALRQLRPQVAPQCFALYAALLAEPQLLKALKPDFSPENAVYTNENVVSAQNQLYGYRSILWDAYAKTLRPLIAYVDQICIAGGNSPSQGQNQNQNQQSTLPSHVAFILDKTVKLLTLVKQNVDFARHYKLYLAAAVSPTSQKLRNVILSEQTSISDAAMTDDVTGLLSLPLTDRREWFYVDGTLTSKSVQFKQHTSNSAFTPTPDVDFSTIESPGWLRQQLGSPKGMQLFDRAAQITIKLFETLRKQQKRTSLDDSPLLNHFIHSISISGDVGIVVIQVLSCLLGRPSEENLLAALILKHLSEKGSVGVREVVKQVARERELRFMRKIVWRGQKVTK